LAKQFEQRRMEILSARGLFALKLVLPRPPCEATFRWLLQPPDELPLDAVWFIDGSLFDQDRRVARRTGFGTVTAPSGALIGFGNGTPPDWIHGAAGAEVWAFFVVARLAHLFPFIVTSCSHCRSLPECVWLARSIAQTAKLVQHQSARLGFATRAANHHEVEVVIDGGATVRNVLRDSTAARPKAKVKRAARSKVKLVSDDTAPSASVTAIAPSFAAVSPCRPAKRPATASTHDIAHKRRRVIGRRALERKQLADNYHVARWISERVQKPPEGASGSERMAALIARVLARAAGPDRSDGGLRPI